MNKEQISTENEVFDASKYILRMENITKTFLNGKIVANNDVTLKIKRNEVHTLIGENGSGKSTLMSIIFGLYKQDKGNIYINDKHVDMYHSGAAKKHKIGMVHQHFHLIDKFSVLENIILGQEKQYSKAGIIDYKKATQHFQTLLERYNFDLDPKRKVKTLNVGQKQIVEIMKVLWEEKDIIVFDEPTATLSVREIEVLLGIIKTLKEQGKTIIFISHKLQEVKEISDTISILNKGELKGTFINDETLSKEKIADLMFNEISSTKLDDQNREVNLANPVLEINEMVYDTSSNFRALNGVSFKIYEGEIFGLAGIEGNGQEEIINCLTGLKKITSGSIKLNGEDITKKTIAAKQKKMSHIPIDRLKYGLSVNASIKFNSIISDLNNINYSRFYFRLGKDNVKNIILNDGKIVDHTQEIIERFQVDGAQDISSPIRNLSGGNQQKFVIGRELTKDRSLLVAGHPTRGLDIKAINNIYQNLIDNSPQKATLLYSLEISELMNVCDRIAILYKGNIIDIIDPKEVTMKEISNLMIGEKQHAN